MKKLLTAFAVTVLTSQAQAQFSDTQIVASKLFKVPIENIDKSEMGLNYKYNPWKQKWKAREKGCRGYKGGHSGIDIQTKDVAGTKTADRKFYSLSAGKVIRVGGDSYNTIAIYNSSQKKTYLYLHARRTSVTKGEQIQIGEELGIQGDAGTPGAEHVHFEVRQGEKTNGACGATTSINPISNTIDNLVPEIFGSEAAYGTVSKNDWNFYKVPFSLAPSYFLTAELFGMSRNADLYLKSGTRPSAATYDCRSEKMWGLPESCTVGSGTWYIGVRGIDSTNYILEHNE